MTHPGDCCKCGCGQPTPLATRTVAKLGQKKGLPINYLPGHGRRANIDNLPVTVADTGYETPCHLWQKGVRKDNGYAHWGTVDGRSNLVHRAVWEHAHGPAPKGWTVHHKCLVRHCVRLDHLEALPGYAHQQEQLAARLGARQAQDSLTDQMLRTAELADRNGQYDAADWIRRHFAARSVA